MGIKSEPHLYYTITSSNDKKMNCFVSWQQCLKYIAKIDRDVAKNLMIKYGEKKKPYKITSKSGIIYRFHPPKFLTKEFLTSESVPDNEYRKKKFLTKDQIETIRKEYKNYERTRNKEAKILQRHGYKLPPFRWKWCYEMAQKYGVSVTTIQIHTDFKVENRHNLQAENISLRKQLTNVREHLKMHCRYVRRGKC